MKGLPITHCKDCPFKKETNQWSSDGWDQMEDWICEKAGGRKIQGAVEWHEIDKIKIPDWCPLPDVGKEEKPEWKEAGPGPRGDMDPESWGDPPDWRPREMGQ